MKQDARLALVLAINLVLIAGLLLVGLLAHSLGVLAAAADYLGDAVGAGLSLVAYRARRTHAKATTLAALVNASFLLAVTLAVIAEAVRRLASGAPAVHGVPVVAVSAVAAIAMLACAVILGDVGQDLSMQSVLLDSVADAAAAIGVAISGAVILATGGNAWLDAVVALTIAVVVAFHALKLLRRVWTELRCARRESNPRPAA